ncbi:MAG: ATP-binding protein, partial [Salinivirgaceae bacterium]|nr:ATP-binding protein [Salinivirgaceae bacterium]
IQISVTTDNETVDIQISDTGVGMDQKIIDSLFKIDEFVSQKGTSGELGTGFGLLLIKDFVDKHQGSIIVKSEVGKGSVFIVKLPLSIDN